MKYLILPLVLFIVSCTDNSANIIDGLEKLQKETQTNLVSCQNSLDAYRNNSSSGSFNQLDSQPEPEQPKQPEYEEVDVWYVDGTKCYGANESDSIPACGRSFWDCKDGFSRNCMTNVKYKTSTEQKLVE